MSINDEESKLFAELKKNYPNTVPDGVVDENEYLNAPQEVNNVPSGFDLRDFINKGARPQTWDNVTRWTEAILSGKQSIPWEEVKDVNEERRRNILKKIAAVNLKKTPGGHTSDIREIIKAAKDFKDIVQKQLDLYKPDYIILCGTERAYIDAFYEGKAVNWVHTERGIDYFKDNGVAIISFCHPEARIKDNYMFYALLDAINEIKAKEREGKI